MAEILRREAVYLWFYFDVQFRQIAGFYALGMLLGSFVSVFLKSKIHGLLAVMGNGKTGVWGTIPASLLGIASPLCMYGTVPLAASFSRAGVRDDWLASFMMSSVLLNPQLIVYSAALGPRALVIRVVLCFVCGALAGILVRIFYRDGAFFRFTAFDGPPDRDVDPNPVLRLLKNIARNIRATGGWFLLGVALSAVFQRYVPSSFIEKLFGGNSGFGVLMAATIGVPLYACGGATIPLLQQWLADGMSMGSAAAFMISGPATKITNLGALKIVLGTKRFVFYILFSLAFSFLSGLLVDLAW